QDFLEPVSLEVRNLPPGVTATRAAVPAGQGRAELELTAAPTAVPIDRSSVHVAVSAGEVDARSPAFILSIAKPSFTFSFEPSQLKVRKGESRTLKVKLNRTANAFLGPVEIEWANLPKYVKALRTGTGAGRAEWQEF